MDLYDPALHGVDYGQPPTEEMDFGGAPEPEEGDELDAFFSLHPQLSHLRPMHSLCFERLSAMNKKQLQEEARKVGIAIGKKSKDQLCAEILRGSAYNLPFPMTGGRKDPVLGEWVGLTQEFWKFAQIVHRNPYLVAHFIQLPITFPQQLEPALLLVGEFMGAPVFAELRVLKYGRVTETSFVPPTVANQLPDLFMRNSLPARDVLGSTALAKFDIPRNYVALHEDKESSDLLDSNFFLDFWNHSDFTLLDVFFCVVDQRNPADVSKCHSVMSAYEKQLANPAGGTLGGGPSLRRFAMAGLPDLLQQMLFIQRPMDAAHLDPTTVWETKDKLQKLYSRLTETRKRYPQLHLQPRDLDNFLAYQAYQRLLTTQEGRSIMSAVSGVRYSISRDIDNGDYTQALARLHDAMH